MTIRSLILPTLLVVTGSVRADYALPAVEERLILLLTADQIDIDGSQQTLTLPGSKRRLSISRFWMQDRIWGTGICVGVSDEDPRSAVSRIQEVARAISGSYRGLVLVELVRVSGSDQFIVTYLKLFDSEREYVRYFPKRQFSDTIDVSLSETPKDAKKFVEALVGITKRSLKRLAGSEGR